MKKLILIAALTLGMVNIANAQHFHTWGGHHGWDRGGSGGSWGPLPFVAGVVIGGAIARDIYSPEYRRTVICEDILIHEYNGYDHIVKNCHTEWVRVY